MIKTLRLKNELATNKFYEKIIIETSNKMINLIKSQNLIDVRTPSFLNAKLNINKANNLFELNKRLKEIDVIEDIFVQELNNEYVLIKIKYLGKLNKIINQLKDKNVILEMRNNQWV